MVYTLCDDLNEYFCSTTQLAGNDDDQEDKAGFLPNE